MKILLVSAPLGFPLANYCLAAQLAAAPETGDCEIEVLDLETSRLNEYNRKNTEIWRYVARLEAARPDLVGFSVYLWSHLAIRELVSITARLFPQTAILVGGPELATPEAARPWLEDGAVAAAIHGEGEITLVEIVERLRRGRDLAGVKGCSWWNDGSIAQEARRPAADLGKLASPYLTGWVPDDSFVCLTADGQGEFERAIVETYRGCYMQCSYCQWGNGTRLRFPFPEERVRGELSWILSRNVSTLWIVDAMFGYKKRIAKDLLRHIIDEKKRYGAQTSIVCYHNQDFYDSELLDLYREADVSVEVDLQSTDPEVLTRVGRAKWYVDSFDRHLEAFRKHQVPTSGTGDLIIGLPGDRLSSFADSVDFLLRRQMNVTLYQTSMIPDTPMMRNAEDDGIVFSATAPRAVFKNDTFPLHEMIAARLIGHGVDFFRRYPKTARLLWHLGFERPVDLCRRFGDLVWERHELMYGESQTHDAVLAEEHDLVAGFLGELCPHAWLLPIARDLFCLECAAANLAPQTVASRKPPPRPVLSGTVEGLPPGKGWLEARPRFRREAVEEVRLQYRLDDILQLLEGPGELPPEETWRNLRREPLIALLYLKAPGHTGYRLIDEALTHQLLIRFSGYFSVAECLDNLAGKGWRIQDLEPLWKTLSSLARAGFIDPGLTSQARSGADVARRRVTGTRLSLRRAPAVKGTASSDGPTKHPVHGGIESGK